MKYCLDGQHTRPRQSFFVNGEELATCDMCRQQPTAYEQYRAEIAAIQAEQLLNNGDEQLGEDAAKAQLLPHTDASAQAVPAVDWILAENFRHDLDHLQIEACSRCHELWLI